MYQFLSKIQQYSFCIHGDTYKLVEHSESVNTADMAILFKSYHEFQTSDWGDSSWYELIILASLIWEKSIIYGYPCWELYLIY
jgi:hypothetical protein